MFSHKYNISRTKIRGRYNDVIKGSEGWEEKGLTMVQ